LTKIPQNHPLVWEKKLNYDGFGNLRSLSGSTNAPAGTAGDFRFHGAWWEAGTDLYNMRAREYDQRTGRFLSRDPDEGLFRVPESLNPYVFALNNPFIYADPSGAFTLTEINLTTAINTSLQAIRTYAVNKVKAKIRDEIVGALGKVTARALAQLYPGADDLISLLFEGADAFSAGIKFEHEVVGRVCKLIPANITEYIAFGPAIRVNGDAIDDGIKCPARKLPTAGVKDVARPDFVFGEDPPTLVSSGRGDKSVFIGDLKLSGNSLYKQYVKPGGKRTQFKALVNYADKHTYTRIVLFLTVFSGERGNLSRVSKALQREGLRQGVVLVVFSAIKNKNY
jgi:RHS repeat-associated protein